jgi:hypothetical protein
MRSEFLDVYNRKARADQDATATGALDWTVPEATALRANLIRAMALARAKAKAIDVGPDFERAAQV